MNGQGPLTDEHRAQIKDNLKLLDEAEKEMIRAKAAGIDVGDYPNRLQESRKRLNQIQAVYFPKSR